MTKGKTILYSYKCGYSKLEFKCKVENVHSVTDEPYPAGGELRVCRNEKGQAIAAPLVSELTAWEEVK